MKRVTGTFIPVHLANASLECIQLDLMGLMNRTRDPVMRNELQRLEAKCKAQRIGLSRTEVKLVNQEAFVKRDFLEDEAPCTPGAAGG